MLKKKKEITQKKEKNGHRFLFRVVRGKLIVERIASIEELLEKPAKVTITFEEFKEHRRKLSREAEQ